MRQILSKNKRGKIGAGVLVVLILAIAMVVIVGMSMIPQKVVSPGGVITTEGRNYAANCPSDYGFSGTVTVQNSLNTTGAETFDTTMYFSEIKDGSESFVGSITDTTSGSLTSTDCGKVFVGKVLTVAGAAGDNSYIERATMSGGEIIKVENGYVYFAVTSASGVLNLYVSQNGLPQIRAFDMAENAFMYDQSANSSAYNTTDGVTYANTAGDDVGTTVNTAGSFKPRIYLQSQISDEAQNDRGVLVLVDAATTVWNVPVVKFNGFQMSDYSANLNPDEKKAYNGYEYVYLISRDTGYTNPNELLMDFFFSALSGVNPAAGDAPSIDLAPIGTYTSVTDSNLIKVGAVKDDSSQTQVNTLWDINFTIA